MAPPSSNGSGVHPSHSGSNNPRNKAQMIQEKKIVLSFFQAFQGHLEQLGRRYGTNDPDALRLYDGELQLLRQINNFGLAEGVVAGVVTFAILRTTRAAFLRRIAQQRDKFRQQQQQQQAASSSWTHQQPHQHQQQHMPPTAFPPGEVPHVQNSPFLNPSPPHSPLPFAGGAGQQQQQQQRRWRWWSIMDWAVDVTASFFVAATASFAATDTRRNFQIFAQIPLTPGPSTVSDEFCPVVLRRLQELRQQAAAGNHAPDMGQLDLSDGTTSTDDRLSQPTTSRLMQDCLDHPQSPQLAGILQFASNCQKRQHQAGAEGDPQHGDEVTLEFYDPGESVALESNNEWNEESFVVDQDEDKPRQKKQQKQNETEGSSWWSGRRKS